MRFIPKVLGCALLLLVTVAMASCTMPTTGTGGPTTTAVPPTTIVPPSGVLQVSAGGSHTCALLTNHTVTCSGGNNTGQLGNATNNGTGNANPTQAAVVGLTGVSQIAAGGDHTCALLTTGTVTCWGYNYSGQLGNATNNGTGTANPSPTAVVGLTGVTQITAGLRHTCALLTTGIVTCWGDNGVGQLGNATNNGTANANPTRTAVAGLTGVTQITAGGTHTCALLATGTVSCWGNNLLGQLGNATNNGTVTANPTPAAVVGLTGVSQITGGIFHTCALLTTGTATCWGYNTFGQLGNATNNGTDDPNPTPTAVVGLTGVTQITAGGDHTCALLTTGTATCWGRNDAGQLGNATNNGTGTANPTPTAVAGLTGVTQITAGGTHTCAPLEGGIVTCWGSNRYGQLGSGTNSGTGNANPTPAVVVGIP